MAFWAESKVSYFSILVSHLCLSVLHCGLPDPDGVKVEELDHQVRPGGEGAANHEPVSNLRLQEQDLPGVSLIKRFRP